MAIFVGLILLQFQNIQHKLLAERVAVLATNTAQPFNAATSIGIPLASVRNAGALLERARQTDDAITAILVVDAEGNLQHRAGNDDTAFVELAQPEDWAAGTVNLFDDGRIVSFNPIVWSPGERPGAIVVALDGSASINRTWAMGAELAAAAIAFFTLASMLIAVGLRTAFASEISAFAAIERDVELFDRDTWMVDGAELEEGGELHRVLNNTYAQYRASVSSAPSSVSVN
ncbi:hypothetical protein ACSBLW_06665 [Thioclava sp. FR2]|uniref:hypothetical protein n=1 Tax=Thioclava sp. FR2 TaxID=3445780 RepID=UPI003EBB6A1E